MKNKLHIYMVNMLLVLMALTLPTCDVDGDLKECPYDVRLEYWYDAGGSTNRLADYISRIDGYVFDSEGVLCATYHLNGKEVMYGKLDVAPGRYTLVSWGNVDTTSHVYPEARIGESRLKDMQLYLDDSYRPSSQLRSAGDFQLVSEKLYYNFQDLEVSGQGVTRGYARMTHAHCLLNLSVVWKYSPPENTGNFSFTLSGVPLRYAFPMSGHPDYPLPGMRTERGTVGALGKMNIVRTLSGELVCYRLEDDDHPLLSVYQGDQALVDKLDLWKFFTTMNIDLSGNLRQEFDLKIEIDGTGVFVSTLSSGDWEDGGVVDGVM